MKLEEIWNETPLDELCRQQSSLIHYELYLKIGILLFWNNCPAFLCRYQYKARGELQSCHGQQFMAPPAWVDKDLLYHYATVYQKDSRGP